MKKTHRQFRAVAGICAAMAAWFPAATGAIEIPLESFGKGTRIAYVNMHKVFESFPDTEKARVELSRAIEEKRSEVSAKKEEIARLKGQIDFLKKQSQAVDPTVERAPQPEPPPLRPSDRAGSMATDETGPVPPTALTALTLPQGSPLGFLFTPPEESTATKADGGKVETREPEMRISTSGPQILPGVPSVKPQLAEKEAQLLRKQADLEAFVGAAEEEVKAMEEGKTMTLLARIYKVLEEISAKEGYTIVVDRDNILYGEGTIDITQNVIWRLSGARGKEQ